MSISVFPDATTGSPPAADLPDKQTFSASVGMSQREQRTFPLVPLQQREPRGSSLDPQRKVLLKLLEFASLVGTKSIGAELDLDFIERPGELERHLRIVLVDNRRSRVLADVKTFVERKPDWLC